MGGPGRMSRLDGEARVEASRQPCPACREPIDVDASRCPHCRSEVLVDVIPVRPVSDGRLRYRAARSLAALAGGRSFLELQNALAAGDPVLAGVTRGVAARASEAVAPLELRTSPAAPQQARPARAGGGGVPRWAWVAAAVAAVALVLLLRSPGSGPADPAASAEAGGTADGPPLATPEIADLALPGTVSLRCEDSVGSGFFVAPDRVLTNAHVLCEGNEPLAVHLSDGRSGRGKPLRRDDRLDLALLEVSGVEGQPLALGDAGRLRVGDVGVMIGSPVGLDFTVHEGRVSNLDRIVMGVAFMQVDARVNPGNSGGPLLDSRGRVVGVVSLKATGAEGIGLALPINYAFAGPSPLVASPLDAPSPGFDRIRQSADAQDEQMASELRTTGQRPGLMSAGFDLAGGLIATVTWPSAFEPFQKQLNFNLLVGGVSVCEIPGTVARWDKLQAENGGSPLPPRTREWLERHGFSSQMWVARFRLDWMNCADRDLGNETGRFELELQGADSDAARIPLS